MQIKNTLRIALISLFFVSALTKAESAEDYCKTKACYFFFGCPASCIPVKNTGKGKLEVKAIDVFGANELIFTLNSGDTDAFVTLWGKQVGAAITVTNLDNKKILFNDWVKDKSGLNCNDTQCVFW